MKKNLLKSTFAVSSMTIISRITGFLRDLVFAHVFGAVAGLDAFLVAFKIPNFMRRLFAEGAFSQAFVPVLSEYRQKKSQEEIKIFIDRMAGALVATLFLVTLIAVIITPYLVWLFAPGFINDPQRYSLATAMLRITFPYLFFISLTAFVSGILNTYDRFGVPAFTPNLLNLILIGASIFLAPYFKEPVTVLAWGVFFGGAAQLSFQLPFLRSLHLMPRPKILWRDEGVKRVLKLMLPAVFGVSVAQVSLLIDTIFASFLREGSLSWLYYSDRISSFPLGVCGIAIATVVLPHLSSKHASDSTKEFSSSLDWAIRFALIIAIPSTLGILILSGPILTTLLQYGKFTAFDVTMAQRSLMAFACGIPAFMLVKILASSFYAKQNIKTPVRIAIIAIVANILFAAALIVPLAHAGLALATTLTASLNAFLLIWVLLNKKIYRPRKGWGKFILQLIFASSAMTLLLLNFSAKSSIWLHWHWLNRAWHLGLLLSSAISVYGICLWLGGIRWKNLKGENF